MAVVQNSVVTILIAVSMAPSALVSADTSSSKEEWSFIPRELKIVVERCISQDNSGYCLQKKMVDFLDRALRKDSIPLGEGFALIKSKDASNYTEPMARQNTNHISDVIWQKLDKFFSTRVISMNFAEEGRGKKKKKEYAYYAVAMATALSLLIPLTLKGLALLAAKALLVAKIALVLAGLAALKHFFHHGGGGDDSHRRVHLDDLAADAHAHNLAYSAYTTTHHIA